MKNRISFALAVLALASACASAPARKPAAAEETLRPFIEGILSSSRLGEKKAADELIRVLNENMGDIRLARLNRERLEGLEDLYDSAHDPKAQKDVVGFLENYGDFEARFYTTPHGYEKSYQGTKERFLEALREKHSRPGRNSASREYTTELEAHLSAFAATRPSLKETIRRLLEDASSIWKKTRLRILGKTACEEIDQPESIEKLGAIVRGVATETTANMPSRQFDELLDRKAAAALDEDEATVRQNRICPLINQCGVFDRSRGAGCE